MKKLDNIKLKLTAMHHKTHGVKIKLRYPVSLRLIQYGLLIMTQDIIVIWSSVLAAERRGRVFF